MCLRWGLNRNVTSEQRVLGAEQSWEHSESKLTSLQSDWTLCSTSREWTLIHAGWWDSPQDNSWLFPGLCPGQLAELYTQERRVPRSSLQVSLDIASPFLTIQYAAYHTTLTINSASSTKGARGLCKVHNTAHATVDLLCTNRSPSIAPPCPHWGLGGRLSDQNNLRDLTKVFFLLSGIIFCYTHTERNALGEIGMIMLEIWPGCQRQEEEENPGKREGAKPNVPSVFLSRKLLTFIITHLVLQLRIKVALHQTLPEQPSWLESAPHLREPLETWE